jgi:hypothetical protein
LCKLVHFHVKTHAQKQPKWLFLARHCPCLVTDWRRGMGQSTSIGVWTLGLVITGILVGEGGCSVGLGEGGAGENDGTTSQAASCRATTLGEQPTQGCGAVSPPPTCNVDSNGDIEIQPPPEGCSYDPPPQSMAYCHSVASGAGFAWTNGRDCAGEVLAYCDQFPPSGSNQYCVYAAYACLGGGGGVNTSGAPSDCTAPTTDSGIIQLCGCCSCSSCGLNH